jgi:ubiquinone/menaquinone biosynthesis C-methylase UbiE
MEQEAKMKAALKHLMIKSSFAVLDLGCGTGLLFNFLNGKVKLLIGLDLSLAVLKLAKKQASDVGKFSLVRADADYVPFRENIFHVVFAFTLLQNMPDPIRTLREIIRISKPYGKVVVTGLKKSFSWKEFKTLLEKAGLKILRVSDGELKGYVVLCAIQKR